jgi:hypothetical protein
MHACLESSAHFDFIGPQGLYLSNANPDNPDLNEDVLSYTLFKLETKAQ